jgi:hypothetical protein
MTSAYPTVPAGAPLQAIGGDIDDPSHVNFTGSTPPFISGLVKTNADDTAGDTVAEDAMTGRAELGDAVETDVTERNGVVTPDNADTGDVTLVDVGADKVALGPADEGLVGADGAGIVLVGVAEPQPASSTKAPTPRRLI